MREAQELEVTESSHTWNQFIQKEIIDQFSQPHLSFFHRYFASPLLGEIFKMKVQSANYICGNYKIQTSCEMAFVVESLMTQVQRRLQCNKKYCFFFISIPEPETIIWEKKHFHVLSFKLKLPLKCVRKKVKRHFTALVISCHEITFSFFSPFTLHRLCYSPFSSDFDISFAEAVFRFFFSLLFGFKHLTQSLLADEWWFLHDLISFVKSLIISFATPFALNDPDMPNKGILIRPTPTITDAWPHHCRENSSLLFFSLGLETRCHWGTPPSPSKFLLEFDERLKTESSHHRVTWHPTTTTTPSLTSHLFGEQ